MEQAPPQSARSTVQHRAEARTPGASTSAARAMRSAAPAHCPECAHPQHQSGVTGLQSGSRRRSKLTVQLSATRPTTQMTCPSLLLIQPQPRPLATSLSCSLRWPHRPSPRPIWRCRCHRKDAGGAWTRQLTVRSRCRTATPPPWRPLTGAWDAWGCCCANVIDPCCGGCCSTSTHRWQNCCRRTRPPPLLLRQRPQAPALRPPQPQQPLHLQLPPLPLRRCTAWTCWCRCARRTSSAGACCSDTDRATCAD